LQKYDYFLKKPLISARISHFSCKIIDFRVNFLYFFVYLHIETDIFDGRESKDDDNLIFFKQ